MNKAEDRPEQKPSEILDIFSCAGVLDDPDSKLSDDVARVDLETLPSLVDGESVTSKCSEYVYYKDGATTPARKCCRRPSLLSTLKGVALLVVFLTAFGYTATLYRKGRDITKVQSAMEYYAGNRRSPTISEPVRTPEDEGWQDSVDLEELQLDHDLSLPKSTSTSPSLEEARCPEGYEPRSRRYRRRQRERNLVPATKSIKAGPDDVPAHCIRVDDTRSTGATAFQTKAGKKEGRSNGSKMRP